MKTEYDLYFDLDAETDFVTVKVIDIAAEEVLASKQVFQGSHHITYQTSASSGTSIEWQTQASQIFSLTYVVNKKWDDTRLADVLIFSDFYNFHSRKPGRSLNLGDYRFGASNGQEMIDEISGTSNHYTAEFWEYNPRLGRRWQPDPVDQISISNYAAFGGNPIMFIDPNGDSFSPYFTEDGEFLGTDEEGFSGEIMITSRENFESQGTEGTPQKDDLVKGGAYSVSNSNLEAEAISNIYTRVLDEMEDVDASQLYNNAVSVYTNMRKGLKYLGYNDPEPAGGASQEDMPDGSYKVTMNAKSVEYLNTVANAMNTLGAHEFIGHGERGLKTRDGNHHKVYEFQMSHPTFKKTTPSHQDRIKRNYQRTKKR